MVRQVKILGISGSGRKDSYNTALLKAAQGLLPENASLEIFDVSGFPLFNADREKDPPPQVIDLKRKIREADAVLFAVPEFNFSVSAQLKNAIEWANRPDDDNAWDGKPAAMMSASTSPRGGARAQLILRQIMVDLNMYPLNQPQVYIGRAQEAFDSELGLKEERYTKTLASLLRALVDSVERYKSTS